MTTLEVRARHRIAAQVSRGTRPAARTLPCFDCGKPAREYAHWNGYANGNDVQPVCKFCHVQREMARRPFCRRGHPIVKTRITADGSVKRECQPCYDYRHRQRDNTGHVIPLA